MISYRVHLPRVDIFTASVIDYAICLQGISGNDEAFRYLIDRAVPDRTIERVLFRTKHRRPTRNTVALEFSI